MKAFLAFALLLTALSARAAIVAEPVEYKHGDTVLEGVLYYDDAVTNKRPGVLVVPEWWGLGPYGKDQAPRLAAGASGNIAADMYGKGVYTHDPKEASERASTFYGKPLMAERAAAGLQVLAAQPRVDAARLGAMGYCFGGSTVFALAYSGAPLRGAVSFHGSLPAPQPAQLPGIQAHLLVCHGADDTFVKPEAIADFKKLTETLSVQFVSYPGAVHSFTNPEADSHKIPGVAYQKAAADASWQEMLSFFAARLK